eukprot:1158648-Pelagomonas_calceolata.AAC.1
MCTHRLALQATALVMHELMCTLPAYAKNGVKSSPFIGDTNGFASANPPSRMSLNVRGHQNEALSGTRQTCIMRLDLGRGRLQASLCVRLMEEGHAVSRRKFENLV